MEIVRESPRSQRSQHSRDVVVNTELNDEERKRLDGMRNLESYITTNHTLSYADRLLLQKFRRNQQAWFAANEALIEQFMYSQRQSGA